MRVRFSRFAAVACIVAGVVIGLLALLSKSVSFVGVMTPIAFIGFGIALLTRRYLIVDENTVVVKALIGSTRETYRLGPAGRLELDGARVFIIRDGERRRLRGVTGRLANRHDWAALRAWADGRKAKASTAAIDDSRSHGGPHAA